MEGSTNIEMKPLLGSNEFTPNSLKSFLNLEEKAQVVANLDWVIIHEDDNSPLKVVRTSCLSQDPQATNLKMTWDALCESADRGVLWQYNKGLWCWPSNDSAVVPKPSMFRWYGTRWTVSPSLNLWLDDPDDQQTTIAIKEVEANGNTAPVCRVHLKDMSVLCTLIGNSVQTWTLNQKESQWQFESSHTFKNNRYKGGELLGAVNNRFVILQCKNSIWSIDLELNQESEVMDPAGRGRHRLWLTNVVTVANESTPGCKIFHLKQYNDSVEYVELGRWSQKRGLLNNLPWNWPNVSLPSGDGQRPHDYPFLANGRVCFYTRRFEGNMEWLARHLRELLCGSGYSQERSSVRKYGYIVPTKTPDCSDSSTEITCADTSAITQIPPDKSSWDPFVIIPTDRGLIVQSQRSVLITDDEGKAQAERAEAPDPNPQIYCPDDSMHGFD